MADNNIIFIVQILMSVPVVLTTVMPMLCVPTRTGVLLAYVSLVILGMEWLVMVHTCNKMASIVLKFITLVKSVWFCRYQRVHHWYGQL